MEPNPAGQDARPAAPAKTWKDYIGWVAFAVTAVILAQQVYTHAAGLWDFAYGESYGMLVSIIDHEYVLLNHFTNVFYVVRNVFFTLYPLMVLVLLLARKKIVPRLLVLFAATAIASNITAEVLYNLLAARFGQPAYIDLVSAAYLAIDILLVVFYAKFQRFRLLFAR